MSDDLTTEEAFAGLAAVVPPSLRGPIEQPEPVDPTITFGSPIEGKPFALAFDWDGTEAVLFLTAEQVRVLVASGDASLVEHRQATCPGHRIDVAELLDGDRAAGYCETCDLELVQEADGTVVPVGEGS